MKAAPKAVSTARLATFALLEKASPGPGRRRVARDALAGELDFMLRELREQLELAEPVREGDIVLASAALRSLAELLDSSLLGEAPSQPAFEVELPLSRGALVPPFGLEGLS